MSKKRLLCRLHAGKIEAKILMFLSLLLMVLPAAFSPQIVGAQVVTGQQQLGLGTEVICSLRQGGFCSLELDTDGKPHVAFYDAIDADLKYASREDTGWIVETVEKEGWLGMWPDLALDAADRPHISYSAADETFHCYLKYATWNGSAWKTQTVDRSSGAFSSLALDSQGNPHISYNGVYSLNYASWNGLEWKIETVDPGWSNSSGYAQIGMYTSLALDSNDRPFISYYDQLNGDLKHANWNGSNWIIQTVDSEGDVGIETSLVLDSNDYPHIAYRGNYLSPVGLRYAAWNGTFWNKQTVEPQTAPNHSVDMPCLKLDSNGQPHLSYINRYGNFLKYAVLNASSWQVYTLSRQLHGGYSTSLALGFNNTINVCHDDYTDKLLEYITVAQTSNGNESVQPAGSVIQTAAFVFVQPSQVSIGQSANITMLIEPLPPPSVGQYRGLYILITRPTGTTERLGPIFTDSKGYANLLYVTQETGTYVIQLAYAGEFVPSANVTCQKSSSIPVGLTVLEVLKEVPEEEDTLHVLLFSDDFSRDLGAWQYLGSAYRDAENQYIVLTAASNDQAGVVFLDSSTPNSFTANFRYMAGGGYQGDGFTMFFYKQKYSNIDRGGSLGFSSSSPVPGYGIEFDGWQNMPIDFQKIAGNQSNPPGDPSSSHIALIKDHAGNHLAYVNDSRVADGRWHEVSVDVQPTSVEVRVDNQLVLQWTGTSDTTYSGFGFSAGNGQVGSNLHVIDDFHLIENLPVVYDNNEGNDGSAMPEEAKNAEVQSSGYVDTASGLGFTGGTLAAGFVGIEYWAFAAVAVGLLLYGRKRKR